MSVLILHDWTVDIVIGPFETAQKARAFTVNQYGFAYQSDHRVWTVRPLQTP
jgi:hypothetical protein